MAFYFFNVDNCQMDKLNINGINAAISFDADINLFRGEFVGLYGYADFYASDIAG